MWSDRQIQIADAMAACKSLAERLVVLHAELGYHGAILYARDAVHPRSEFKQAALDLRRVGGDREPFKTLAMACELVMPNKSKAPLSWKQRVAAKHRKRTKESRQQQASNHR